MLNTTYWDTLDWILAIMLAIFAVVALVYISYGLAWIMTPYQNPYQTIAKVKSTNYADARTSFGVGAFMTTSSSDAHYNMVFETITGELWFEDDQDMFRALNQGDEVLLSVREKTVWGEVSREITEWKKKN